MNKIAQFKPNKINRLLRLRDLVKISIREVMRKRRRYLGVVLAITIGTAGLITIATLGGDLKQNFNNDLDLLGGSTIIKAMFEKSDNERDMWFWDETLDAVREIPHVRSVTATVARFGIPVTYRRDSYQFTLLGIDEYYWSTLDYRAALGRLLSAEEIKEGRKCCVIGNRVAARVFGSSESALGKLLNVDSDLYTIVGVLGGIRAEEGLEIIYIPQSAAKARVSYLGMRNVAYVRCNTWDDVAPVYDVLAKTIKDNQPAPYLHIRVGWEALKHTMRVFFWVSTFIYISIAATLILGGMGIWNIMMAAVSTRTREIGLKKAMGAQDSDILLQFLFESLFVTISSSILGVILGRIGMDYLGKMIGSAPPEGTFWLYLVLGIVFAAILGLGAGLYPSIRASRMQVVDAMRFE